MAMQSQRRGRLSVPRLLALCISAYVGLLGSPASAAEGNLEYQVKAAFLLNFTKFIEWPPNAFANSSSPFAICILGNDPFGRALDDVVAGEAVGDRRLIVRRIDEAPAPQACQVVFIAANVKDLAKIMGGLAPGVLTVGEGDSFVREGGIIGFVIDNRRVRFDISPPAAERATLKLSSKLLSVARSVGK
ncbi:MAG TPA: YfiR family protein [Bryobacteraceae bacterium]|nr:YfiR family protein [Bryobacteraceae bacterium]